MEKLLSLPTDKNLLSPEPAFINALIRVSLNQKKSFAIWKLPDSDSVFFICDFSADKSRIKTDLEKTRGFIFSSFDQKDEIESFFIRPDLLINLSEKSYQCNPGSENKAEEFLKMAFEQKDLFISSLLPASERKAEISPADFKENVRKAIQAIQSGEFKKVVLARAKYYSPGENFDFGKAFSALSKDTNVFVSLVHLPGEGIWMGGSPELLVSIDKNKIFKTIALAGTQQAIEGENIAKSVWTQKEIEEQALVSRYIINCFKAIRLREFEEDGPRTVHAGNLIHLKTSFSVNLEEVDFPNLGTVMLNLLHPTSAVCGMPKERVLHFINENEKLDRKFYSGFLGPVNIENETRIFVNIRCAEFLKDKVITYSGAGITQESDPEKEFEETELKMKAIGRILEGF